jgi:signal transduction histidine kinase
MQKSSEVNEVISVLFRQFDVLGIHPNFAHLSLYNDEGYATVRMTDTSGERVMAETAVPLDSYPEWKDSYEQWKKSDENEVQIMEYKPEVLPYVFGLMQEVLDKMPEEHRIDPYGFPNGMVTVQGNCRFGYLGINIERLPTGEEKNIVARFAREFGRIYQRVLDLEKAEAQAREAEIELGLERVRARAMAMQKSDELSDLVDTVFKELTKLDFALNWCIINIVDEPSLTNMVWAANPETNKPPESYLMKFEDYPFHHSMLKGYQERKTKHVYVIEGEEKKTYDDYLFNKTEWRRVPKAAQDASRAMKRYVATFTFSNFGGLQTVGEEYLSEENLDILSRFGKVFDLTYTRFNDLKQAEAQARESQIQLALERVRARTMAMQRSEELPETSLVLYEQFKQLGEPAEQLTIGVVHEENNVIEISATLHGGVLNKIYWHSIDEPYMMKKVYQAWKTQQKTLIVELKGDQLNAYNKYRNELTQSEMFPTDFDDEHRRIVYAAFFSKGMLAFAANEPRPPQSLELLERFAAVFDLTYTRFLDLQKAEAQAREAEIELALERVRSRSMGMQKSEELKEVIKIVYQQLIHLNINLDHAGFVVDYKPKGDWTFWIADERDIPSKISHPYFESVWATQFNEAKEKGTDLFVTHLNFEEKNKFYNELLSYVPGLPQASKDFYLNCPGLAASTVLFDDVSLYIENFSGTPYTDEDNKTLMRFGKVFEQSYTRFLDLQKAEAQAREAEIQLALERARLQSMTMQHSVELDDTLRVFHEQVIQLGIRSAFSFLWLPDEEKDRHIFWAAWAENNATAFKSKAINYPLDRNEPATAQCLVDWKGKEPVVSYQVLPAGVESYFAAWSELIAGVEGLKPENFTEGLYYVEAFIKYGCFGVMVKSELTEEEKKILYRFAVEFESTYTRFLDLQKAEAQAREAQIEVAMERVRARAMAMHQTDELTDVLCVLFDQFDFLGINPILTHLTLFDEENETFTLRITTSAEKRIVADQIIDVNAVESWKTSFANWKKSELHAIDCIDYPPEALPFIWELMDEVMSALPEGHKIYPEDFPDGLYTTQGHCKFGYIGFNHKRRATEEEKQIVVRIAKEFGRLYQRFLDIQKAEAQAREAQIESALEKVRSQSLAMHTSSEMQLVANEVSNQLRILGLELDVVGMSGTIHLEEGYDVWLGGADATKPLRIPFNDDTQVQREYNEVLKTRPPLFAKTYSGQVKKEYIDKLLTHGEFPEELKNKMVNTTAFTTSIATTKNSGIQIVRYTPKPFTEEENGILKRFAKVFEQAYIRFMDLERAEAQAKEAQIEAALEKVRSRSLSMQRSDELQDVVQVVAEKLTELGVVLEIGGIAICTYFENSKDVMHWTASNDPLMISKPYYIEYYDTPMNNEAWEAKLNGESFFEKVYSAKDCKHYFDNALENTAYKNLPEGYKELLRNTKQHGLTFAIQKNSTLMVPSLEGKLLKEEDKDILIRFSKVFEQAYIRFMDIKKSEEQARESQIQLALERVRARTMAMHKSEELAETAAVLFQQMTELGVTPERLNICLIKEDTNVLEVWSTDQEGTKINHHFNASLDEPTTGQPVYKAWKEKKKSLIIDLSGKELNDWVQYVREVMGMTIKTELVKEHRIHSVAFFSHGMVLTTTPEPLPEESLHLLERFADVFNLTYRRFLDLQKAEAQVRESQIEAALERVRAKAMAMNNSVDLSLTINTLFKEIDMLGLTPVRCGLGIVSKGNPKVELWVTTKDADEVTLNLAGTLSLKLHPMLEEVYKHWELQQEFHPVLKDEELKKFISSIQKEMQIPDWPEGLPRYDHYFYFPQGTIYVVNTIAATEEELSIYRRFTSVMALTYQRYDDIVKSEERAKEAIKDSSLDRVRAEIASMRSTEDLQRITPLVWRELTTLEVPFFRCGVFIINEEEKKVNVYLSAPDGHSLGVMHLPFEANELTENTVDSWRKQEVYTTHWDKEAFTNWMKTMSDQGQIKDQQTYQGTATAPESLDLHFIPFKQGMLYVGNSEPLQKEKIELVDALAAAFAIAYARYEDFNKIEQAKLQVEETLADLKQTQTQLIQSEKMASLGELTAGIAHEIQNPLNFVNNFSEVSKELLDEMREAIEKGDAEEAKEIMNDVIQNLEKINHHGKRADGIVKGMLQHSRSSSGTKEPTDINVLADEYLRLAYHGLRAKDKSFNATMKTEYEEGLEKVNVIPQDIGRVILNLITNAFYVVNEKSKQGFEGYEPTVSVSTKKEGTNVLISVKDNGNGIPQKVLDKIFQPFFTTKPTGQGTGLGLSLSYDIVKAHGGELKVETKEGEGSAFIIQLPVV